MPVSRDAEVQRDVQPSALRVLARPRRSDLAALGELDGVADQVDEHLPQPDRVADDASRARRGRCRRASSRPFLIGAERQRLQQVVDQASRSREGDRLEVELARLDLREVEDVVEDRRAATRPTT